MKVALEISLPLDACPRLFLGEDGWTHALVWLLQSAPFESKIHAAEARRAPAQGPQGGADNSALSPELKSWIGHCVVPLLVREYLSEHKETFDRGGRVVASSRKRKREVLQ